MDLVEDRDVQYTDLPSLPPHSPTSAHHDRHVVGARRVAAAGFTLLELLVVIVIIGMLAGLVAPRYFDQVSKSNTKIAKAQIDSLGKALDQYRLDVGSYPTTEQSLAALNTRPQNVDRWAGPYLKKAVPPDPWGVPYIYKSPGDHGDYDLQSYGSDGQPGGVGEAADVVSW
jgi:general secretion pathway protein G